MDLDLHIGSVLHLEGAAGAKSAVRLIGMVPGSSLLVTMPEGAVAEGDDFAVRVSTSDDVLTFRSTVQRASAHPYPYLHLSYPDAVESMPARHAQRARVWLNGSAETDQAPGRQVPVSVHDLSTLGAMVWSDVPIGAVGESMILRLPLEHEPVGGQVAELVCEIRNQHEDHGPPIRRWGYGVEFASMSSATALALRSLVMSALGKRPA
jgi:hypothetical protein